MNTLETHTLHPLYVSTILYVVIFFVQLLPSSCFSLKQTLASNTFFFFFIILVRHVACFYDQTDVEEEKKKREMFHLKIFELIDWVPTDRNISISIYI